MSHSTMKLTLQSLMMMTEPQLFKIASGTQDEDQIPEDQELIRKMKQFLKFVKSNGKTYASFDLPSQPSSDNNGMSDSSQKEFTETKDNLMSQSISPTTPRPSQFRHLDNENPSESSSKAYSSMAPVGSLVEDVPMKWLSMEEATEGPSQQTHLFI
ncbi:hypothetical protein GYMLUDRAFT_982295 [Collybiopsis luxurians FD-317 M1]|nr:hypothetical protein GYMLUDRAFT_982295 [Collybiopsis luxurians FD-317 M1]